MRNYGFTPHLLRIAKATDRKRLAKGAGFTLIELLVAFSLFLLILAGTLALVQTGVRAQRATLQKQAAVEEASFLLEYMSRAIRGAKKDATGNCLTTNGAGYTFETTDVFNPPNSRASIRFLDRNEVCREFFWTESNFSLQERVSADATDNFTSSYALTSDDFVLTGFWLQASGSYEGNGTPDYVQPHVTFTLALRDTTMPDPLISLQTTVTTRTIDVP